MHYSFVKTQTYLGHVPFWLPMISDCAVYPPEKYIFRLGFISGANWLFISSLLYYLYFRAHDKEDSTYEMLGPDAGIPRMKIPPIASLLLATLASISVGVVGAVSEDESPLLHKCAALSFFSMLQLYMALTTYQMNSTGLLTRSAFYLRVAINIMAMCTYIAFIVFERNMKQNGTVIAICEVRIIS